MLLRQPTQILKLEVGVAQTCKVIVPNFIYNIYGITHMHTHRYYTEYNEAKLKTPKGQTIDLYICKLVSMVVPRQC